MKNQMKYLTLKEASLWATDYTGKQITTSNISYLVQYGRVSKIGNNGSTLIPKLELVKYYSENKSKENIWKEKLGRDLDWKLSFDNLTETDRTKHVHKLHPYKGKFIPQLVEYFLNPNANGFNAPGYFQKNDIVLDPFCGSGTTLVQANELGLHAIGIDVSSFNAFISNCKTAKYDIEKLGMITEKITDKLYSKAMDSGISNFEDALMKRLKEFNDKHFHVPEFKYKALRKLIDEKSYGVTKEKQFLPIYEKLIMDYKIELVEKNPKTFSEKWHVKNVRDELNLIFNEIETIEDENIKKILILTLSRTARSCRTTTHSDLATLTKPAQTTYYCHKHGKICKPVFSIMGMWHKYSKDVVKRLKDFEKTKTDTHQYCLTGDSRTATIPSDLLKKHKILAEILQKQKISGIFSSPPYVGLIDYHEQHAYAYDLLGFKRMDEFEIGPLFKGHGKKALKNYVCDISDVLNNCKRYLKTDYNVFLVANDKYNLYPEIAEKAQMKIVKQFKRPVLNRTEKNKNAYCEMIFLLKGK